MKKRGFGEGKLNGYGGKVGADESIAAAAIRELNEETGISADQIDLEKVAEIDFYFADIPEEKNWNQTVHVFFLRTWHGSPHETEEMKPEWHRVNALPMDKMWVDDKYWLMKVIEGKKIRASFTFAGKGESVLKHMIHEVSSFE
jgi:8-oxo-dGTP pyrophosphatase MutT (NUDIX family)